MLTPLAIGMVGHGFMGRAHSNAYSRVNQFFDVAYQPVLKAVAGRYQDSTQWFAKRWGWERAERRTGENW
jgi:predicted dehydrogenase